MTQAPGWYPDPYPSAPALRQRWWDGTEWTAEVRNAPPPGTPSTSAPMGTRPWTTTPVEQVDDLGFHLLIGLLLVSLGVSFLLITSLFDAEALRAMLVDEVVPATPTWSALLSPVTIAASLGVAVLDAKRNPWFAERRSSAARYLAVVLLPPVYLFLRDTNAGQGRRRFWTYVGFYLAGTGVLSVLIVSRVAAVLPTLVEL